MNQKRAKSPSNFDREKAIEIEVKFQNERKIERERETEQTRDGMLNNINGHEHENKVNENGLRTKIKSSPEHFIPH